MTVTHPSQPLSEAGRYVRAPEPVFFPEEAEVPESRLHRRLTVLLEELVMEALGDSALVGSDQFLYWVPTDASRCCAPDLMVKRGSRPELIRTWKVWERGAPELCAEIVSRSDAPEEPWERKLARYRQVGLRELLRFDPADAERPLRIWETHDGDLVERAPDAPGFSWSETLGLYLVVVSDAQLGPALRLSRDAEGRNLVLSVAEAREAEAEARKVEAEARARAEARVRELEAELEKRR